MVDTSINPTGQKSAASASVAPVAVPKTQAAAPASSRPEGGIASSVAAVVDTAAKQPASQQAAPIVSKVSGLATYRDPESGRLVVQIFDQKRGDVILEFPTENMLRSYPTSASQPAMNSIIETKA